MTDYMSSSRGSSAGSSLKPNIDDTSYCFLVEWFDSAASLARKYRLTFWAADSSLELFDLKNKRVFLKRAPNASISLAQLFVGSQITVYARSMKIIGYGDESTRGLMERAAASSIAIIKPAAVSRIGAILTAISTSGLRIARLRSIKLNPQQSQQFFGDSSITSRVAELASGTSIVIEMIGQASQAQFTTIINAINSSNNQSRDSLAMASSERSAREELEFLFSPSISQSSLYKHTSNITCVVIKPHIVASGDAGAMLSKIIEAGFAVTAIESFHLSREAAEEFMSVYKGVVPEYQAWVDELTTGIMFVAECQAATKRDAPEEKETMSATATINASNPSVRLMRELAGPYDPTIAQHLFPHSLRATFGKSKVKNAIHVTDLAEDGQMDCEFFFSIMQQQ